MSVNKWHKRFMKLANEVASWSKDPDSKVGAVLISPDKTKVSYGYNGFPRSLPDSEDLLIDKDTKLALTVHAELNCILNATQTKGWSLYTTKPPCLQCALAIVQSGANLVVCPPLDNASSWYKEQLEAISILQLAQCKVLFLGDLND